MARYKSPAGGFSPARGERKKSHIGRNSLIFIIAFMTYHIGYGCRLSVFPVDPATGELIIPMWYPLLGIAVSAAITAAWAYKKELVQRLAATFRWGARRAGDKLMRESGLSCEP